MSAAVVMAALAALLIGGVLGVLWQRSHSQTALHGKEKELLEAQAQLSEHKAAERARAKSLEDANKQFQAQLKALAGDALSQSQKDFLNLANQAFGKAQAESSADLKQRHQAIESLVKPIRESQEQTRKALSNMQKENAQAQGELSKQIELMASSNKGLRDTTQNLVTALRRPEVRGQWGEMQLRRLVEIAGLLEHCDFDEQPQGAEGKTRPDMIVNLPEGGQLVVDAKTPLDAYLRAVEETEEHAQAELLAQHARNVEEQIRRLASKEYWNQLDSSPDFVVMFVPGDHFLAAAGDRQPDLMEKALRKRVILATPTSMMALLRVTAYGWRQLALTQNAQEISKLAATLLERVYTFSGLVGTLGKQLNTAIGTYNRAAGSFLSRLKPALEKMENAGVESTGDIKAPEEIATAPVTLLKQPESADGKNSDSA
ncbi:DNA recombination protein RmuC [Candidatus Foliamicus sp.]